MNELVQPLIDAIQSPMARFFVTVVASFVLAFGVRFVSIHLLSRYARTTKTDLDDQLIDSLKGPVFLTVILVGIAYAAFDFQFSDKADFILFGLIKTVAVIVWGRAAMKIGSLILQILGRLSNRAKIIQPSTLPLFDISIKIVVVAGIAYFALVSWHIDVTGWLASAGIVGIAIGFAAKDTLANLFAGIFIVTDAPYKIGDFIQLDKDLRGKVTQIGIRSTRILTRDDIEITVPNATIANSRIINETAGPHEPSRVRTTVEVAYGSDVDRVREVLLSCATGLENTSSKLSPSVRFVAFGASGLVFQVRVFIEFPKFRGRVIDNLNTCIYKALNQAGIKIPFPQQDVYIKQMPGGHTDLLVDKDPD